MIARLARASVALATLLSAVGCSSRAAAPASTSRPTSSAASSGSGPLAGPDVYGHTRAGLFSPATQGARALVYVPNLADNTVSVIDQSSLQVVDVLRVGRQTQHVVPSWTCKRCG